MRVDGRNRLKISASPPIDWHHFKSNTSRLTVPLSNWKTVCLTNGRRQGRWPLSLSDFLWRRLVAFPPKEGRVKAVWPLETNEDEREGRGVDGHGLDEGDDVAGGAAKREPTQPEHADNLRRRTMPSVLEKFLFVLFKFNYIVAISS